MSQIEEAISGPSEGLQIGPKDVEIPSLDGLLSQNGSHATRFTAVSDAINTNTYSTIELITAALEVQNAKCYGRSPDGQRAHSRARNTALKTIYSKLEAPVAEDLEKLVRDRASDYCAGPIKHSTLAAKVSLYQKIDPSVDERLVEAAKILTCTGYSWVGETGKAARAIEILDSLREEDGTFSYDVGSYNADLITEMQRYVANNTILSKADKVQVKGDLEYALQEQHPTILKLDEREETEESQSSELQIGLEKDNFEEEFPSFFGSEGEPDEFAWIDDLTIPSTSKGSMYDSLHAHYKRANPRAVAALGAISVFSTLLASYLF